MIFRIINCTKKVQVDFFFENKKVQVDDPQKQWKIKNGISFSTLLIVSGQLNNTNYIIAF